MAFNLKILKLLTGEELLAEVLPSSEEVCRIKNPVRVVMIPSRVDPEKPQIGLAPWAQFSDDKEFTIDKSHVLTIMTPIKEFENQYNTLFGGIIAPPKLILPTGA